LYTFHPTPTDFAFAFQSALYLCTICTHTRSWRYWPLDFTLVTDKDGVVDNPAAPSEPVSETALTPAPEPIKETGAEAGAVSEALASSSEESADDDDDMDLDETTQQPEDEQETVSPSQDNGLRRSQRLKDKAEKLAAQGLSAQVSMQTAKSKAKDKKKGKKGRGKK
jgi:hypothetical protein